MCIIIACEPNHRIDAATLARCWQHNPDGAGFMYTDAAAKTVVVSKGYMTLADYRAALATVPQDTPLVLHMRIATSGGVAPRVTHPFPVTRELEYLHALDVETPYAVAHNGMLPYPTDDGRGISDTVSYIRKVVAPLAKNKRVRKQGGLCVSSDARKKLAETSRGSRLALLDYAGNMRLIGNGWQSVTTGIRASNGSWRASRWDYYGSLAFEDDYGITDYDADDYPVGMGPACETCAAWRECVDNPMCYAPHFEPFTDSEWAIFNGMDDYDVEGGEDAETDYITAR